MNLNNGTGIEAYPVGILSDWKRKRVWRGFRGYLIPQVQRRNWRAVRNYFNGYLAEWHYPPEGMNYLRCGRGWTRKAALRDAVRKIVEDNMWEEFSR